jgi:REP element-mobilizing transposase RayT
MRGIYHDQLPHWVVDYGCYSLTFHCKDSLPAAALLKLREIVASEASVASRDEAYVEQSRQRFAMMEHYLDQSHGACPFAHASIRSDLSQFIKDYDDGFRFRHWVVMPNHWHLLTEPVSFASTGAFKHAIKLFKMRSTAFVNKYTGLSGRLWMRSGYDRWVRDAVEYQRWVKYLHGNPVKACLCRQSKDWVGLK